MTQTKPGQRVHPDQPPAGHQQAGHQPAGQWQAVAYASSWFFCILFSYMTVRPVRESLGVGIGTEGLKQVMWMTLGAMMVAVPLYAWLVSKLPRRWLVRVVYHFFAACSLVFFFVMQGSTSEHQTTLAYVFFIWVNVFSLFATSVFWSVLTDVFGSEQGKRLFGMIAGGGTAGAIGGSMLTFQIAPHIDTFWLLLIPTTLLEIGLVCAWRLERRVANGGFQDETKRKAMEKPSGGLWSGIVEVIRTPYLAMICVFLFFAQSFGTQLYFQQAGLVKSAIVSESARTSFFASVDLGTQCLTLLIQVFVAQTVLKRLGVRFALVALPIVYLFGFTALALTGSLTTIVMVMIASRSIGFGLAVPAREVLFTVVTREQKYKSKNFIDTVLLRAADATAGATFTKLGSLGFATSVLNWMALPVVLLWCVSAFWLGRKQRDLAEQKA